MQKQIVYGIFSFLGLILTWYHNILFFLDKKSVSLADFINDCYINHASTSITNDITIAAIVFLIWSFFVAFELKLKGWFLVPISTLGIAFAFTFPLYLLIRERHININARLK